MKINLQSKKTIAGVWACLVVFLFLMLAAGLLENNVVSTSLILALAIVQMLLIAFVFMHLCISPKLFWVFAAAGIFWLAIMFTLVASDYLFRYWH